MTSPIVETLWQRIRDNLTDKIAQATALAQQALDRQQAADSAATRAETAATDAQTAAGSVTWGNLSGKPEYFPTNTANVTGLPSFAYSPTAGSAVMYSTSGRVQVGTPSADYDAVQYKQFTDDMATKADKTYVDNTAGSVSAQDNTLVRRAPGGHVNVALAPTSTSHATSKSYVDARPAFFSVPGTTMPTSIPGAVVGDHVLTLGDMKIHKITGV